MKNDIKLEEALAAATSAAEIREFLEVLLTQTELKHLRQRWAAVQLALSGVTQRSVRDRINVSIETASRSARVAREGGAILRKLLARRGRGGN